MIRTILALIFMTLASQSYGVNFQVTGEWVCEGEKHSQITILNDTFILAEEDRAPLIAEQIYQRQRNDNTEHPIHNFIFKVIGVDAYLFVDQMNSKLTAQMITGHLALPVTSKRFYCKTAHIELKSR